jgi:hypothetical protein
MDGNWRQSQSAQELSLPPEINPRMKLPVLLLGAFANKNFFCVLVSLSRRPLGFSLGTSDWPLRLRHFPLLGFSLPGHEVDRFVFLGMIFWKICKFLLALSLNGPDLLGVC